MFSYIWNIGETVIRDTFGNASPKTKVSHVVPMLWREHCMECSMPLCYATCPLYKKRMDGRCQRFAKGVTPVVLDNYPLKGARIEYRRWAKLQAFFPYSLHVVSLHEYVGKAKRFERTEHVARRLCQALEQYRLAQVTVSLAERVLRRKRKKQTISPDGFLAIIKNEESETKELMLEILQGSHSLYKTKFDLVPGWNERFIPLREMSFPNDLSKKWFIRAYLSPDETAVLTFACFDFVTLENKKEAKPAQKVKCVAWDLDNTLWKGVIGDDGADNVQVNPDALDLIKRLDERGILQTIASKNNHDVAWDKIVALGLENMFLYPAINWEQKSQNLRKIADALNIGIDTFALIDDSAFERAEVTAALHEVRVYDAVNIPTLINKAEFDVPVSEESKNRRQSYLNEVKRKKFSANWGGEEGDYISFLRACELEMSIFTPISDIDRMRCLELILRSNQYNISGHRYDENEFSHLLNSPNYKCLAFRVKDRFGDYGIVGCASLKTDQQDLILQDFVMSCRVAMKHIEKAFFLALIRSTLFKNYERLSINVVKTERNNPLREQLLQMPVMIEHENDSRLLISLNRNSIFQEDIVNVIFDE